MWAYTPLGDSGFSDSSTTKGRSCKQDCFHGTKKCCLKPIWELNIPDLVGFLSQSKTFAAEENWPGQATAEVSFSGSIKY